MIQEGFSGMVQHRLREGQRLCDTQKFNEIYEHHENLVGSSAKLIWVEITRPIPWQPALFLRSGLGIRTPQLIQLF